jgi:energy-coupling factor transporter transmembrane protein EcfT
MRTSEKNARQELLLALRISFVVLILFSIVVLSVFLLANIPGGWLALLINPLLFLVFALLFILLLINCLLLWLVGRPEAGVTKVGPRRYRFDA